MTTFSRPVEILLVDDDVVDVRFTTDLLAEAKLANRVEVVHDGVDALDHLRAAARGEAVRPDVILLDLNMPRMDGHELLSIVKQEPELAAIPVVVMTTSSEEADVLRSYQLHANAYVTKPLGLEQFAEVVRSIESFWFQIVQLPGRG